MKQAKAFLKYEYSASLHQDLDAVLVNNANALANALDSQKQVKDVIMHCFRTQ